MIGLSLNNTFLSLSVCTKTEFFFTNNSHIYSQNCTLTIPASDRPQMIRAFVVSSALSNENGIFANVTVEAGSGIHFHIPHKLLLPRIAAHVHMDQIVAAQTSTFTTFLIQQELFENALMVTDNASFTNIFDSIGIIFASSPKYGNLTAKGDTISANSIVPLSTPLTYSFTQKLSNTDMVSYLLFDFATGASLPHMFNVVFVLPGKKR